MKTRRTVTTVLAAALSVLATALPALAGTTNIGG